VDAIPRAIWGKLKRRINMTTRLFTEYEKKLLEMMDREYKWVIRDKSGDIWVSNTDPDHIGKLAALKMRRIPFNEVFKGVKPNKKAVQFRGGLLDAVEKRYLESVLKPLPRVAAIVKRKITNDSEYLRIDFSHGEIMCFPYFKINTMYKNMKASKKYTPEELDLNLEGQLDA
jgi:hypothetical protein